MSRRIANLAFAAATLLCSACLRDVAPADGVFAHAPVAAKEPPNGDLLRLLAEDLPPGQKVLRFGITPYNTPREIHTQFQPIANQVSKVLGVPVAIVPSSSYPALFTTPSAASSPSSRLASFVLAARCGAPVVRLTALLRARPRFASESELSRRSLVNNPGYGELVERVNVGTVDLALLSPLSYVLAERTTPGLQLLARTLTYGAPAYSSFLIVRTRDPARRLEDLKGRRVAWVDPLSTAGFLFPYGSFVERGLDPAKDLQSAVFAGHAFLGPSGADCGGVTISIGAAMHPDDAQAPYDLIGRADQALYAAKTRGRNRVVSYPDVQPA